MTSRFTLPDGTTIEADDRSQTITAPGATGDTAADVTARMVAAYANDLMGSGMLVGPQVDEMVGITGDWEDPRAPFHAVRDAARTLGLTVTAQQT